MGGATSTTNRGQTATTVGAALAGPPTEVVEPQREKCRYVTVWLPLEEEKPVSASISNGESTLRFVNLVIVVNQINSG